MIALRTTAVTARLLRLASRAAEAIEKLPDLPNIYLHRSSPPELLPHFADTSWSLQTSC